MESLIARVSLPVPVDEAFAWHERPGALERLSPPWERIRILERKGTIHDGDRVVLSTSSAPGMRIEVVHYDYMPGRSFSDNMVRGPFARFAHRHDFLPDGEAQSILEDHVSYALPLGGLGRAIGGGFVGRQLARMFEYRHETLRRDLIRHAQFRDRPPLRIAITGASGVLGTPLGAFLSTGGHEVLRLVRRAAGPGEIAWDPARGELDPRALEGVDAVIHLAGENVGVRWNAERKRRIVESRVAGTGLIAKTIAGLANPPRVLISASGIGIYGIETTEVVDETSPLGDDFLADVCKQWEAAVEPARAAGIRVVSARLGVVLTPTGGALAELLPVFRKGIGGPIGNGTQVMSWISLDDAIGALHHALFDDQLSGPVNMVAPKPVTNEELAATLGRVLHRPAVMRVPAFAIRALFGEMGKLVALGGVRVAPRRLVATDFSFADPDLEPSLRRVLGQNMP
jgi:uncharacterized protein (TIGR01777 family)